MLLLVPAGIGCFQRAGSWRRLCRSWPTCARRTRRRRAWTSTARCGSRPPARPRSGGRHLLLVVDGLDEDLRPPGSPSVAGLLPALVGAHAHVLVTSRPRPGLPDDVPAGHPLTRVTPVPLDPFPGAGELAELARKEIDDLMHGDDADSGGGCSGGADRSRGPAVVSDWSRCDQTARARRPLRRPGMCAGWWTTAPPAAWSASAQPAASATNSLTPRCSSTPRRCRTCATRSTGSGFTAGPSRWRDAGWPVPAGGDDGTPRYLLDTYPCHLGPGPAAAGSAGQ